MCSTNTTTKIRKTIVAEDERFIRVLVTVPDHTFIGPTNNGISQGKVTDYFKDQDCIFTFVKNTVVGMNAGTIHVNCPLHRGRIFCLIK